MTQDKPRAFHVVRARYVVIAWLLALSASVGLSFSGFVLEWPWYWFSVAYGWSHHILFGALLFALIAAWQLPVRECLGQPPTRRELFEGLQVTAFVFLVSIAAVYATFYPVSFVAPGIVERAYIESAAPLIYFDGSGYPLLPNLLELITLCVAAPVLEEAAFRGILLPRWSYKWGVGRGIFLSSALFAVMHPDPLGAFVFGAAMCALYLRTQSLLLPIVCHGLYNFTVWLIEVASVIIDGPDVLYSYTLEEFQARWPWGAGAAVVCAVWFSIYVRRPKSSARWALPVT